MNKRKFIYLLLLIPFGIFKLIDRILFPKPKFNFEKITFPAIGRCFPVLCAKDLVSVQPMSGPSGKVFYMDFVHEENKKNKIV
jgi:hypothetical protein